MPLNLDPSPLLIGCHTYGKCGFDTLRGQLHKSALALDLHTFPHFWHTVPLEIAKSFAQRKYIPLRPRFKKKPDFSFNPNQNAIPLLQTINFCWNAFFEMLSKILNFPESYPFSSNLHNNSARRSTIIARRGSIPARLPTIPASQGN